MRKLIAVLLVTLVLVVVGVVSSASENWAFKAEYAESCCCSIPCPCTFGMPPTMGHCEGNGLVVIEKGHMGDVNVDGLSVVLTFGLGQWIKLYVDEKATDEQVDAVEALLKQDLVFGDYFAGETQLLSIEKAPITMEWTEALIKFSVPASTVEIEMLKGLDGGPITIENLLFPSTQHYTQYRSITQSHKSDDKEFNHVGTNGFTSKILASSGE